MFDKIPAKVKKYTLLIASFLTAFGLAEVADLFNYLAEQSEVVFTAVATVVAFATALITDVKEVFQGKPKK